MEFDFDKLISVKNVNEAEVGKEYYFFNEIDTYILQGDFSDISKAKLEHIYKDSPSLPFLTNEIRFSFLYPVEEPEKQYITFTDDELYIIEQSLNLLHKKLSRKSNQMVSVYITEESENILYNMQKACFDVEDLLVKIKAGMKKENDCLIKNLTDINGKPLIKEE